MAKKSTEVVEVSEKEVTLFERLFGINVNDKLEKKANLSYLSWAWAWAEVKKIDPAATSIVHEFPMLDPQILRAVEGMNVPYLQTPTGYFVKVSVTIHGQTETEWLPVMDHRNKTMEKPTAFDINKNTKRCLVKAIALHGLGLYVYAGEDLPEEEKKEQQPQQQEPQQHLKAVPSQPPTKNFVPITPDTIGLIKVLAGNIAERRNTDVLDTYSILLKNPNFKVEELTGWTEEEGKNFIIVLERWVKKLTDGGK